MTDLHRIGQSSSKTTKYLREIRIIACGSCTNEKANENNINKSNDHELSVKSSGRKILSLSAYQKIHTVTQTIVRQPKHWESR